jgi:DNA-binding MarR family transcriptional regulator
MTIEGNMRAVLYILGKATKDETGSAWVSAEQLRKDAGLTPADLNNAVEILAARDLIKLQRSIETPPFMFAQATITAQGRLSLK